MNFKEQLNQVKNSWLTKKFIAHRGLWGNGISENTLLAFENAINNNYAIETDVWKIKDGTLVIFHDDSLKRLCGVEKNVWEIENLDELKSYRINSEFEIPTFEEFLNLVNGKTEILIEIKGYTFDGVTEKLIYERLKKYNGEFAIESFNPYSVY